MAKKGTASATIGLNYSAFEVGAKIVLQLSQQMATFMRDTLAVAAGNVLSTAFTRAASSITTFAKSMKDNLLDIFSTGEEMANLAHATDMAAGEYAKFSLAASKGITMGEAATLLGRNADIFRKDADIFRDVSLKLYAVGQRIQGFWLGVADKIAPVLMPLLDRLMALDLSQWGEAFATPIANAVAVITQLALDGTLWQTMGDLAAASFTYAGQVLGKVIAITTTEGFETGLKSLWEGIKSSGTFIYEVLENSIGQAFAYIGLGIVNYGNYLLDIVDKALVFMGAATQAQADEQQQIREDAMQELIVGFRKDFKVPEWNSSSKDPIFQQIKDAISSTQFGSPELFNKLSEALSKFERDTSPSSPKFTNNTAMQNFGVSSLAAIGGGGGVGFVSLADHAAEQTRTQKSIDDNVREIKEQLKISNQSFPTSSSNPPANITIK